PFAVAQKSGGSDLTLKEAVEYLSHSEEQYQQRGATFIQHTTYNDERTKSEVFQLGGIPGLVTLLRKPQPRSEQAAAGALRNLVFKDQNNKLEVQHCGGIGKALQLLKETDSTETQKQITVGLFSLLWNLSSSDELKKELIDTALPALTENVVTHSPSGQTMSSTTTLTLKSTTVHRVSEVRILTKGNKMRNCAQLIDSLMSYIQSCVAEENPDDESVENCACILHNLSYQLEQECPESYSDFNPQRDAQVGNKKDSTVGCFSPKSSKAQKESSNASGVKWLCHPKAMETYLSLLGTSQKDATLEACCGALRNLTASKGVGSSAVSHMLVQKFKAPLQTASLLKSPNPTLQTTAIALLGNMSRNTGLQRIMGEYKISSVIIAKNALSFKSCLRDIACHTHRGLTKQILPELTSLLSSGSKHLNDLTLVTACNTARRLMLSDTEISKKVISHDLVYSLKELSENK
uniref:Plakophilin 1 n=1 Tax=Gouania willdenowi TaxID=441366 RepID=A0A8C5HJY9_GOUWI